MRSGNNNSYDFHCSSDSRFVKVAVKNNFYHTLRIEAQAARSINLTGGTRRVEEILITRCFKLTRIHWPKYTGAITRLRIFLAESMTKLDLSSLSMEGLLELSILDCAKLTTITGLPATLKWLNIHGTNIDHIDVSHCQQLEVFNVSTPCPVFKADLINLPSLQSVSIVTTADKTEESHVDCELSDCPSLRLVNINTGNIPAAIDINKCPNLAKTAITGGHGTTLQGLSACAKLEFFHSDYPDKIKMNEASRRFATQHSATAPNHPDSLDAKEEMNDIKETFTKFTKPILHPEPGPDDDETVVQLHGSPRERNHACMVRINLLSLPLEPLEERFTESYNKRTKRQIESLPHYLNSAASYIYYLDKTVKKNEKKQLEQSAIIPLQGADTLVSWLQHPMAHKPLMITEESLKSPAMIEFLESYNPNKKLVIYKNKFYRLTPMHKIVAEESVKHTIESILSVQPPAAAALMKSALGVLQQLAAKAPSINPVQLQSAVKGLTNQMGQAYNTYVNSVLNPGSKTPAPQNLIGASSQPMRHGVLSKTEEPVAYARLPSSGKSQPIKPLKGPAPQSGKHSGKDDTEEIVPPFKVKAKASVDFESDPWKSRGSKTDPEYKSTDEEPEKHARLVSGAKSIPIQKSDGILPQAIKPSDDDINLLEGSKPDPWKSRANIENPSTDDEPEKYSRLVSGAKSIPIEKSDGKKPQVGTARDDDINPPSGSKIIANADDTLSPDPWKSGARSNQPIPDLQGHDEIEPISDEENPADWATLHGDDNDEPIPHARAKAEARAEARAHKLEITNSKHAPLEGKLIPDDNEDRILASAKTNAAATAKTPDDIKKISPPDDDDIDLLNGHKIKAQSSSSSEEEPALWKVRHNEQNLTPPSFTTEELPTHAKHQGTLEPSKDQLDDLLASARAQAESNQHRIVTENLPMPTGQHGTLDTTQIKPAKLLASAGVNVKATGKPTLTAKAGAVKTPSRPTALLDAATKFAEAMQQMANIAKASASSDDERYDHLLDASDLIDDSIRALTITASVAADKSEEAVLRESLEAANNLADAVKRLNNACKQLDLAVKNTAKPTPPTPQPAQKSPRAKVKNETMNARLELIQALTAASEQFIEDYSAKKLSGGLFGTGLQAGINTMRLEFLTKILRALKTNQTLPEGELNLYLKDIMTNPQLKKALAPHESDLRSLLTKSAPPSLKPSGHTPNE